MYSLITNDWYQETDIAPKGNIFNVQRSVAQARKKLTVNLVLVIE